MKWEYITYRVEWQTVVVHVDQYGKELDILYCKPFSTREEAVEHLENISKPHKYVPGRRVWNDATNKYTETYVRRREVKVQIENLDLVWKLDNGGSS